MVTKEINIDDMIEKQKKIVSKNKKLYEAALKELDRLLCERDKMLESESNTVIEKQNEDLITENKGISEFMDDEFECDWKGFAVWEYSTGSVDCHYRADIVLRPEDKMAVIGAIRKSHSVKLLQDREDIRELFIKDLCDYLDREFDRYCTCDDYYQPVVEDFEIESYVSDWCKEYGFRVVLCEGEGHDDGYEPKLGSRWY